MDLKISYKRAETKVELEQILKLQKLNLPSNTSKIEMVTDGFVTVDHDIETLKQMNEVCPHIIAVVDKEIVGYALCMHPSFNEDIEVLKPMFFQIEKKIDPNLRYIVMGQICIAKEFRKKGFFKGLYNSMEEQLNLEYDAVITEVDSKNTRSMRAHLNSGFLILSNYKADSHHWNLLIKHWK